MLKCSIVLNVCLCLFLASFVNGWDVDLDLLLKVHIQTAKFNKGFGLESYLHVYACLVFLHAFVSFHRSLILCCHVWMLHA